MLCSILKIRDRLPSWRWYLAQQCRLCYFTWIN